ISPRQARSPLQPRFHHAVDHHDQGNAENNAGRQALQKIRGVFRHAANERIRLAAEDDVQQYAQHDQQEDRLNHGPADRAQPHQKIHVGAGRGVWPHPSTYNQTSERFEKSHMMMATAISPARPFLPRSATIPTILLTTPPKNGRVPPIRSAATIASPSSINPISVRPPIHILTRASESIVPPLKIGIPRLPIF